jgi:DNA-binding MarR family transcriptional regulator
MEESLLSKSKNDFNTKPFKKIHCACTNLKMASRVVGRAYDSALASSDLTSTQYAILITIFRYQPVSQMSLADHLDMERTTLYRAVYILEKGGWVKSNYSGEGITKILELTGSGEKITTQAHKKWEALQNAFENSFGTKKWQEFIEMLEEIREHFRNQ